MTTVHLYTLVSVVGVSLVSFAGVFMLSLQDQVLKKYTAIFMSIAVGALLGDSFIHLIPEALEEAPAPLLASVLVVIGILLFFILEKFFHWHHHGEDMENIIHPVGKLTLFSDGIHNFVDGVIIAASFTLSIPIGIATTLAVVLHELPQEIGDFAVLLHAGYKKVQALWFNFFSACMAIAGALVFFIVGTTLEEFVIYVLPVAAGGFIYIATADLIPELQKTKQLQNSLLQISAVFLGVFFMIGLAFLE